MPTLSSDSRAFYLHWSHSLKKLNSEKEKWDKKNWYKTDFIVKKKKRSKTFVSSISPLLLVDMQQTVNQQAAGGISKHYLPRPVNGDRQTP